ncbi:MAG: hypothetical protein QHH00_03290 [Methanomassiliicoccales archaeon]|jgi:hypothetical protein|nr:hypothetical protein [Methanomassiliicoccales archaeon]
MARKKKKEVVEEEYEFIPPEFDEKAFLENDIRGTKTLLLTALFAILCGIVAFLVGEINVLLGLVVLFIGMFALRYIYILVKIKPNEIEKKTLFGNLALFFLLFLGIWILMMNPPFSDHTPPQISEVTIWYQDGSGNWVSQKPSAYAFSNIPRDAIINITAKVADNGRLSSVQIGFSALPLDNMTLASDHIYEILKDLSDFSGPGPYAFYIVASDSSGNQAISDIYTIQVTG